MRGLSKKYSAFHSHCHFVLKFSCKNKFEIYQSKAFHIPKYLSVTSTCILKCLLITVACLIAPYRR